MVLAECGGDSAVAFFDDRDGTFSLARFHVGERKVAHPDDGLRVIFAECASIQFEIGFQDGDREFGLLVLPVGFREVVEAQEGLWVRFTVVFTHGLSGFFKSRNGLI